MSKKRRRLFFTYIATSGTAIAHGNIWGNWDAFPSHSEVQQIARERNSPDMDIVITGWNEFKNKEDFERFIAEESKQD